MWRRASLCAVVASLLFVACSDTPDGVALSKRVTTQPKAQTKKRTTTAPRTLKAVSPATVPKAASTSKSGTTVKPKPMPVSATGARLTGVVLPSWTESGYLSPEVASQLDQFTAVGVARVTFIVSWFQTGPNDFWFGPTTATPSDDSLRTAIRQARSRNFEVVLKPHVDLPNDQWRGDIRPQDPIRWFERYGEFITRYADIAGAEGVHSLVIGTELAGTSTDGRWVNIAQLARSRFGGRLVYAANWDEAEQVNFWHVLDEIGIDAYYPLSNSKRGTTSVEELLAAWEKPKAGLRALSAKWQKPIRFTEVGYTQHQGSTAAPWDFLSRTAAAPEEQAAAYAAVFAAWTVEPWWAGPDFWAANPPAETTDSLGYSPFGKPAEASLKAGAAQLR